MARILFLMGIVGLFFGAHQSKGNSAVCVLTATVDPVSAFNNFTDVTIDFIKVVGDMRDDSWFGSVYTDGTQRGSILGWSVQFSSVENSDSPSILVVLPSTPKSREFAGVFRWREISSGETGVGLIPRINNNCK